MRSFEGQGLIRRRQGVGTFVVAKVPVFDSGLEVLESIETRHIAPGCRSRQANCRFSKWMRMKTMPKL